MHIVPQLHYTHVYHNKSTYRQEGFKKNAKKYRDYIQYRYYKMVITPTGI